MLTVGLPNCSHMYVVIFTYIIIYFKCLSPVNYFFCVIGMKIFQIVGKKNPELVFSYFLRAWCTLNVNDFLSIYKTKCVMWHAIRYMNVYSDVSTSVHSTCDIIRLKIPNTEIQLYVVYLTGKIPIRPKTLSN